MNLEFAKSSAKNLSSNFFSAMHFFNRGGSSYISRILKKAGIWAFIVEENTTQQQSKFIEKPKGKNGLVNYQHSSSYLFDLIQNNGFSLLKRIEFVAENFQMEGKAVSFQLYVTKKR